MPDTISVAVQLTFDSSVASAPYNFASLSGQVNFSDGTHQSFSGWTSQNVGTPQPSGAAFSLNVVDSSYTANQTSIGNWALTFIPRSPTTQDSPFGNNENTITGTGASGQNGTFSLDIGGAKIKNGGNWDWTLMMQVDFPNGQIHCFASDPEMDVGA
jgi:hypothetical protein